MIRVRDEVGAFEATDRITGIGATGAPGVAGNPAADTGVLGARLDAPAIDAQLPSRAAVPAPATVTHIGVRIDAALVAAPPPGHRGIRSAAEALTAHRLLRAADRDLIVAGRVFD